MIKSLTLNAPGSRGNCVEFFCYVSEYPWCVLLITRRKGDGLRHRVLSLTAFEMPARNGAIRPIGANK